MGFSPNDDARINYVVISGSAISGITNKRYPFKNTLPQSRRDAIEKLKADDKAVLTAADQRLTPHLGRQPTAAEVQRHVQHGDVLHVDERPLAQRILEDGELRDTAVKDESDVGGNPIRQHLDSKAWDTPKRREMRDELEKQADELDAARAAELEAEAAAEARLNDPEYQKAVSWATVDLDKARRNPASTEGELSAAANTLADVESGKISPAEHKAAMYQRMDAKDAIEKLNDEAAKLKDAQRKVEMQTAKAAAGVTNE